MVGKVTTSFAQLSRTRRLRDQRRGTRPTSSAADNGNKGHDSQQARLVQTFPIRFLMANYKLDRHIGRINTMSQINTTGKMKMRKYENYIHFPKLM